MSGGLQPGDRVLDLHAVARSGGIFAGLVVAPVAVGLSGWPWGWCVAAVVAGAVVGLVVGGVAGRLVFPAPPGQPSPLGYGVINGFPNGFATNIGQPLIGERYTVYLRGASFTRPAGVSQNGPFAIEFLADDGIAMYLDGVEIDLGVDGTNQKRYNCCQDIGDAPIPRNFPPTYLDRSLTSGDENNFITRQLSDMRLSAGQHMIAVSLHNQATTSSDIGFAMRLYVIPEPSTATLAIIALAAVTCLRRRTFGT